MTTRHTCILAAFLLIPACGSRRIAGYLEDIEDELAAASGSSDTATGDSPSTGDADPSAGGSGTTADDPQQPPGSTTTTTTSASTGTPDSDDTGTTGAAPPVCGNGVLEDFGTTVPGAQHCDDWSTSSFLKTGHYGYSDRATPEWTLSTLQNNPNDCASEHSLYCLQSL